MNDISLVQIKHLAPIVSVDLADSTTKTVSITGTGFYNVDKVLFSGKEIKEFTVHSLTEITFTLPPPPLDLTKPIRVVVLPRSSSSFDNSSSVISTSLNFTNSSRGYDRILQKFIKVLLTAKGSNFFDREEGTSLPSLIGSNDPDAGLIDLAVNDAFTQVSTSQSGVALGPQEILREVNVLNSYFNPSSATINLDLELITADGIARFTEVSL